jgi:hypothetical protein
MSDPVDLDAKRKAKAPKCEICGDPEHKGLCPRIDYIEREFEDGTIVRYFLLPYDEPVAGATPD